MKGRTFKIHIDAFDAPYQRVWAVQTGGRYLTARRVVCRVPTESVYRGRRRQPWAFLRGRGVVRQRGAVIRITEH